MVVGRQARKLVLTVVVLALALASAPSAEAVTGALTMAPAIGCVSETGFGDCLDGKALDGPQSALVARGTSAYVTSASSDAVTVFARNTTTGAVTQLGGTAACVSETGSAGDCADGKALLDPRSVAASPGGTSVYVASEGSDAVAVFSRNTTTGELTQLGGTAGCVSETGSGGDCANGKALHFPRSVAVSADGKSVYVASNASDAVAVFSRNTTTGELTQLGGTAGCVSETGSGGDCANGKALDGPGSVAVSADRTSVYVASPGFVGGDAVAVFRRNTATGQLTQPASNAGCVSETGSGGACVDGKALVDPGSVAVSGDGVSVYVGSEGSDAVAVFRRNATTSQLTQLADKRGCVSETGSSGACADGRALDDPRGVAVSADGKSVYVASGISGAVAAFGRATTNGQLTQLADTAGCVSATGSAGDCTNGKALDGPRSVALSGDGKSVYVASDASDAVAAFRRDTTSSELTQLAAGCVGQDGSGGDCVPGRGLSGARSVAVSSDGTNAYVASDFSSAVAVFGRNGTTGVLTQPAGPIGCVSDSVFGDPDCPDGTALVSASSVAVSPGGANVYVASLGSDALVAFERDTATGELTQLPGTTGCVSHTGSGGDCADGKALDGAGSVAVSADGKSVYVASSASGAVAVLSRDTATGALTQLAGTDGCVSDSGSGGDCADGKALIGAGSVAVSADGKSVYVTSSFDDAIAVFARSTTTGKLTQLAGTAGCVSDTGSSGDCADGKALFDPEGVAVSADGKSAYVASDLGDAIAVFARNTTTGELTQLDGTAGCVSETGSGGDCADGKALDRPQSVSVSADGKSVYAASLVSDAVAIFARDTATGELDQLDGTAGCVSEDGSGGTCADGRGLVDAWGVAVRGRSVHVASRGSGAVVTFAREL